MRGSLSRKASDDVGWRVLVGEGGAPLQAVPSCFFVSCAIVFPGDDVFPLRSRSEQMDKREVAAC